MAKIQIFTCYHKPGNLLKNNIITPIHVGKEHSQYELDILCDNIGDHISIKNDFYCELTATYYIWKNVKADYVGLFHYRRFLNFKTSDTECYKISTDFLEENGITQETIFQLLQKFDLLLPKKSKLCKLSLYDYYARDHVSSDMDCVLSVIQEKYPNMFDIAQKVLKENSQGYFANILISSKSFFDGYAHWLFDVLFEVEKRIHSDVVTRSIYQQRVYGFLGERMMSIYIEYIQQTKNIRIKELPVILIQENKKKWRKYMFRKWKRKFLISIGLGKKKWYQ